MDAYIATATMDEDIHPPTLQETPPEFLSSIFFRTVSFIEQNGWYLLGGGVILLYIWSKVNAVITKWLDDRAERDFQAKLHKDPDLFILRQQAQEVARLRLQQQHDAQARIAEEKRKERERKKQEEWLARHGGNAAGAGHRLSDSSTSTQNNETTNAKKAGWRPD
ncbi:selenoprotein S A isoform X2 [Anabrus simplex]|uniref:selenoprotein S A isoform X2 n=1 Tax=Anabrus simplex TaxID=316456 RepID=UPI0034DCD5D4